MWLKPEAWSRKSWYTLSVRFALPLVVIVLGAGLIAQSPAPGATPTAPAQSTTPAPPESAAPAPSPSATPAPPENSQSFNEWLDGVRAEAAQRGIRQEVIDTAFAGVTEPVQTVIERDRSQAETVLSLEDYIRRRLTAALVRFCPPGISE